MHVHPPMGDCVPGQNGGPTIQSPFNLPTKRLQKGKVHERYVVAAYGADQNAGAQGRGKKMLSANGKTPASAV